MKTSTKEVLSEEGEKMSISWQGEKEIMAKSSEYSTPGERYSV